MQADEFRTFTASKGLRGIRGESNIEELQREFGMGRWFDFLDVTWLPAAPLFAELTQPWYVRDDASRLLPPALFECGFDGALGAERNHASAVEGLKSAFGLGTQQPIGNVLKTCWKFDEIELSALTFLRAKTRTNSLYDRHPELWDQCRVAIENPWVRQLEEHDAARLLAIGEQDKLRMAVDWERQRPGLALWERGLLRAAHLDERDLVFWRDRANGRLGWYGPNRAVILERAWVMELSLSEIPGERGDADRSNLGLRLHNPFSRAQEVVEFGILQRDECGSLRQAAQLLQEFWAVGRA